VGRAAGRRADPLAVVAQDRDADIADDPLRRLDSLDALDRLEDLRVEAGLGVLARAVEIARNFRAKRLRIASATTAR
jgi:hypothetical protein